MAVLSILGIGNLRCGPAILASIATYYGEQDIEVWLYDADEERLDLFDRLARLCFAAANSSYWLRSTSQPLEALPDASHIILALGENAARKFLQEEVMTRAPTEFLDDAFHGEEQPSSLEELLRSAKPDGPSVLPGGTGDWNRPTPLDPLISHKRAWAASQLSKLTREELIRRASHSILGELPSKAFLLDLTIGVDLAQFTSKAAHVEQFIWPEPVQGIEDVTVAYQILRWVQKDEGLERLFLMAERSPIKTWLDTYLPRA